jgi:hypothetical protein
MNIRAHTYMVFALLAACGALGGELATDEWGPRTNYAQMAIRVTSPWAHTFRVDDTNTVQAKYSIKEAIKAGDAFSLSVRVRNLSSNETVNLVMKGACQDEEAGLACVIISPSGKDISPRMVRPVVGSTMGVAARPNRIIEFEFPLSRLCKLEEIGTYKVTARKRTVAYDKTQKAFVLTSNTLCVSVVPAK